MKIKLPKESLLFAALIAAIVLASILLFPTTSPANTTITIHGMKSNLDVRIVTNAALNETASRVLTHMCRIDLQRGLVMYDEGPLLQNPDYIRLISGCLAEVGFTPQEVEVHRAGHPISPLPYRLAIKVPNMKTVKDANIVADAIGFARIGRNETGVETDIQKGQMNVDFDSMDLEIMNLAKAIACTGYAANDQPSAEQGTVPPDGWSVLHPNPKDNGERFPKPTTSLP